MNTGRAGVRCALALAVAMTATPAWAATQTQVVSVSATVPSRTVFSVRKGLPNGLGQGGSSTRGSPSQVIFDRFDDQDQVGGSPSDMYAPYRSETGKNWHVADIRVNGSSLTLSADVSGTVGNVPLANVLYVWCGGFFESGSTTPIPGTANVDDGNPTTDDWRLLDSYQQTLNRSFIGEVPFNYRLSASGIPAGVYVGTITYTLVSN